MQVQRLGVWLAVAVTFAGGGASAADFDWALLRAESVIEILTADEDGALRETPVWVVVLENAAYVRTNDSAWLANIRRGSAVRVRVRDAETPMERVAVRDAELKARVEEAFKAKYGMPQRLMSLLRMREPTVLKLTPKTS